MTKNRDRIVNIFLISVLILTFFFAWKCERDNDVPISKGLDRDSLQNIISDLNKDKKIATVKAVKSDSVHIEYVDRWREYKPKIKDLPCDSALPIVIRMTDSIIIVDSVVIADLKHIIHVDSLIIGNQGKVITSDSLTIVGLRKSYKKVRRQRNIFAVIAALLAGVAVVR